MKGLDLNIDTTSRKAALIAACLIALVMLWYVGKWGFADMVALRTDRTDIADLSVSWAPDDPQTHFAAAVLYDKTFLPQDEVRSLSEFERSVALSPDNYLLWLEYGKALSRNGDVERAEAALRQALALAPNYAVVHWTLGNTLVRDGKADEGFAEIARAVEADQTYAKPAVTTAFAFFDGDLEKIRNVIGRSAVADATLAVMLANQKRFDDAFAVWTSIGPMVKDDQLAESRSALTNELLSAKKFIQARHVDAASDAPIGQVNDGGFEQNIKLQNADPFEWQITSGAQPQIAQSTNQPHNGGRSLVLVFSSNDGNNLRQLSQTIAVTPGRRFAFEGFYRSDLRSESPMVWQVVNAANASILAELPLKDPAAEWTRFSVSFTVPSDSEGIILRLARQSCRSSICPINGSIWLDDVSLSAG